MLLLCEASLGSVDLCWFLSRSPGVGLGYNGGSNFYLELYTLYEEKSLKIFLLQNKWVKNAVTCLEASPDSDDFSLFKSCYLRVGWSNNGG